jgi:hypothetical protein
MRRARGGEQIMIMHWLARARRWKETQQWPKDGCVHVYSWPLDLTPVPAAAMQWPLPFAGRRPFPPRFLGVFPPRTHGNQWLAHADIPIRSCWLLARLLARHTPHRDIDQELLPSPCVFAKCSLVRTPDVESNRLHVTFLEKNSLASPQPVVDMFRLEAAAALGTQQAAM